MLQSIGLYFGQLDGVFGLSTTQATQEYQKEQNLYPSGDITPRTRHKLFNPNSQSEFYTSSNQLQSLHPYVEMLAKEFLQLGVQPHSHQLKIEKTELSFSRIKTFSK